MPTLVAKPCESWTFENGKKWDSRERFVKVVVVHLKNYRMLNAIGKSQGLLLVTILEKLVVVERIE